MNYIVMLHNEGNERRLETEDEVKLRYKYGENLSIEFMVSNAGSVEQITGDRDIERVLKCGAITGCVKITIEDGKVVEAMFHPPGGVAILDISGIESALLSIIHDATGKEG